MYPKATFSSYAQEEEGKILKPNEIVNERVNGADDLFPLHGRLVSEAHYPQRIHGSCSCDVPWVGYLAKWTS